MSNSSLQISKAERERLRKELIGKEHYAYYEQKFELLRQRRIPYSFNLSGLLFGYFWALYRGLYGWGLLALLSAHGGLYLLLSLSQTMTPIFFLGQLLCLLPGLGFGFFGNALYARLLDAIIVEGLSLPKSKQEKWFSEYRGGNMRIVLGMLFASVFIVVSFALSLTNQ